MLLIACSTTPDPFLDDLSGDRPAVVTPVWHSGRVVCSDTAQVLVQLEGDEQLVQVYIVDDDGRWTNHPTWSIDHVLDPPLLSVTCMPGEDIRLRYLEITPPGAVD